MHRRTLHQDLLHGRLVENQRRRKWQIHRPYHERNTGYLAVLRLARRHIPGAVAYADLRPLLDIII
jgi:hypothetical protein